MDSKKFMQLVEEKKKKALQKKEAPLKWEQRLEAAVKAREDAEAMAREEKRLKLKQKKRSSSDSSDESDREKKVREENS